MATRTVLESKTLHKIAYSSDHMFAGRAALAEDEKNNVLGD